MKIFVAASYSSQIDYSSGEVLPEYREELEKTLKMIEDAGHGVFCALREDQYRINNADPAEAFRLDRQHIEESDALIALLTDKPSPGVQTEIGFAVALDKKVFLARTAEHELSYFNAAMLKAGVVTELLLPLETTALVQLR